MKIYQDLLKKILDEGTERSDRTGTGVISTFGPQIEFDLSSGKFPLLTTKKLHIKSIIHELLWFLKGDTNIKYLKDNGVTIWDEWADENGDLGKIYGYQLRKLCKIDENNLVKVSKKKCNLEISGRPINTDTVEIPSDFPYAGRAFREWRKIVSGPKPFCKRWADFYNFLEDIKEIDMFYDWCNSPEGYYVLSVNYYGSGVYSPDTCVFLPNNLDRALSPTSKPVSIYGRVYPSIAYYLHIHPESRSLDLIIKDATDIKEDEIVRPKITKADQISEIVRLIKEDPTSRRIVASCWNPLDLDKMALSPCHCLFQFYVRGEYLDLKLYQRSADTFLGVPYNISSYSFLLLMMAQVTGYKPGKFIHTFGDIHIYSNHLEQVKEQLSRDPKELPTVTLNPEVKDIFEFTFEDFKVEGYDPWPTIKAPVAV